MPINNSMLIQKEQPTRAYAYLRVSGKGQLKGDGFARQEAAIRKYALANDIEIAGVYHERAKGATDADDRPEWVRMHADMKESGVEMIVIERLERLARDLMVQEHIIADTQRRHLKLVSTVEPDLLSHDPTRILIRQILGAVAAYDKSMIVLKLKGAAGGPERCHDPGGFPEDGQKCPKAPNVCSWPSSAQLATFGGNSVLPSALYSRQDPRSIVERGRHPRPFVSLCITY